MIRRTPQAVAALLGLRDASAEIFHCSSGAYSARDLMRCAGELADCVTDFERQRVIVPSDDPFAAVCGVVGCWLADATLVLWRRSAIAIEAIVRLTDASAIAERDSAQGRWRVESAGSSERGSRAPGDLVIMTSGSTGQPKGVALDLCRTVGNAALAGSRLDVGDTSFWTADADMSLMSPLGHTLMAWCYQKPAYHLTGMGWKARTALFAGAPGGFGGTPLQLREIAQRLNGDGPRILVSSGDFLPSSLGHSVQT